MTSILYKEFDGDFYDDQYFENGRESGKGWLTNYHWMPRRTFREAFAFIDTLGLDENSKVLDFGGAKGFIVKALRILEIDADVCDISDYALSFAPKGSWNSSIEENWKLHEGKYTHIISKDVFEHLNPSQLDITLTKLQKIAPKMMCVVPLGKNGKYIIEEYECEISHIIKENKTWWKRMFEANGWHVIKDYSHVEGLKNNWYQINRNGNRVFVLEYKHG